MDFKHYEEIASRVRADIVKAVHKAGSGHPGGSLSAADIVTALYFKVMNIDPANPRMEGRDKFILSKGHAGPVQYAALAERGYYGVEDMMSLRKLGSRFQGHPNRDKVPGIEMSTGSLGQGFAVSVGMAMAGKMDEKAGKKSGRVYVLLGDGELQEGLVWEATMAAAHYKLDNLCAIVDWNGLQIDGTIEEVTQFLSDNGYTYPVVMDTTGEIFSSYGISAFPTTFMIDKDGNVYGYVSGQLSEDVMRNIIEQTQKQGGTQK
mgnify:CR=1 FL=1